MKTSSRVSALILSAVVTSLGMGCGESVTAEFLLMDGPPDNVKAVKIFVTSVAAHVVDKDQEKDKVISDDPADTTIDQDDKWQTLDVGKEIDLVQFQGESAAAALGQLELPAGKITQARLRLDPQKPNVVVKSDDTTCNLDLTQIPPTGMKINHVFKVFQFKDGNEVQLLMELDLSEAMKAKGDCYELLPVLKLTKVKIDKQEQGI